MMVDSDDWIAPEAIEWSVGKMESERAQLVQFRYKRTREEKPDFETVPQEIPFRVISGGVNIEKFADDISCAKLYVTEIIRKLGLEFRYRIFEDTHFVKEYALGIDRAVFTEYPFYYYYVNVSSLMSVVTASKMEESLRRADEVVDIYLRHGLSQRAEEYIKANRKGFLRRICLQGYTGQISASPDSKVSSSLQRALRLYNNRSLILPFYCCWNLGPRFTMKYILTRLLSKR